ncbi:MAG: right-handed parallel beta-helix repeat-containing protein, partial [Nanoarchaeota archaeon]|nr:right-handed parallel beta-helix repeat-containing protein [Nanoarchaeota archaeon]
LANNTILTTNTSAYGVYIYSSALNNITGGSIIAQKSYDYYLDLDSASNTNNFTGTNFTAKRQIYFQDTSTWFNYNNNTGNVWLKNKLSAAGSLNRTLATWSNNTLKWNETPSAALTATYNLTGLLPSKTYAIYNTTGSIRTRAYLQDTDASGVLPSFTIALNGNTQIQVQALNLTSCGDLDLPETYNLVGNVSADATCFTIKADNVTLDGAGYWINYSQSVSGYAINDSLGYDNLTIMNLNIVHSDDAITDAHAVYLRGVTNATIKNNSIVTRGDNSRGIYLTASSNSNSIANNSLRVLMGYYDYGIVLNSSSSNILSNNNITTDSFAGASAGIYVNLSSNSNTLINNTITTLGLGEDGIYVDSSNLNNITNNTIYSSGTAYGITLLLSNTNQIKGNILISGGTDDIYVRSSNNNSISEGTALSYYLRNASTTNNFTNTNFTVPGYISFYDTTSWFNYNNETNGNIWLKAKTSSASSTYTRTLTTWSNSTMKWNETPSVALTATYNLTGLLANTTYAIYNTTGSIRTRAYLQDTDASGVLPSFTIALNGNTQIQVQALNLTSCGDLDLPEAYNLVGNVSADSTCFTIKENNVTLDGAGYTINYSQIGNGYGINNTGGWDNITIKNLNIVQDNATADGTTNHGIYTSGMINSNITNNTISIKDGSGYGVYLYSSSNSNTLSNNTISTSGSYGYGVWLRLSSSSNTLANNTISTSGSWGYGVWLSSSGTNTLANNTISTSGSDGYGVVLSSSGTNTLANNTILTTNTSAYGVYIYSSALNNITGGSIIAKASYDYYLDLDSASNINNFTGTNFTAKRQIYFNDATSWFNYRNDSSQNIWLKTNVSAAGSLNRTLVNWNTIVMRWNDTNGTAGLTARYNITGMLPGTTYYVYNTSAGTQENPYTLTADANGNLQSFTIALNGSTEISVGTPTMVSTAASNSNWVWQLPYTGDKIRLGNEVNWTWTTFNNSGAGWTIPRGSATNWTWA